MHPSTTAPPRRQAEKHHAINARQQKGKICVDQIVAATPSLVFQAWLDPNLAGRWLFATDSRPMTRVTIDARPNGGFEFADGSGIRERGRYLDIQPGRRLAFALARPGSRRGPKVVVEFSRHGAGCLLRLTHSQIPADQTGYAEARWEGMLYGLGLLLDQARSESNAAGNPPARLRRVGPLQGAPSAAADGRSTGEPQCGSKPRSHPLTRG